MEDKAAIVSSLNPAAIHYCVRQSPTWALPSSALFVLCCYSMCAVCVIVLQYVWECSSVASYGDCVDVHPAAPGFLPCSALDSTYSCSQYCDCVHTDWYYMYVDVHNVQYRVSAQLCSSFNTFLFTLVQGICLYSAPHSTYPCTQHCDCLHTTY